jgi:hypothetical protein
MGAESRENLSMEALRKHVARPRNMWEGAGRNSCGHVFGHRDGTRRAETPAGGTVDDLGTALSSRILARAQVTGTHTPS